ncbi:hypothetical protein CVS40_12681 [Lucilia cuprina]|nr:hypothetical protein CVS40_12681 [Lucilia cuprina]
MLKQKKTFKIYGIGGQTVANSNSLCKLTLYSTKYNRYVGIQAIVVAKITRMLPKSHPFISDLNEIELEEPDFHRSGSVDLLIGSNVLPQVLLEGVKTIANSLMAQLTIFGWIVSGPINIEKVSLSLLD